MLIPLFSLLLHSVGFAFFFWPLPHSHGLPAVFRSSHLTESVTLLDHQFIGLLSVVGVVVAFFSLFGLVSKKDISLVDLTVQLAWIGVLIHGKQHLQKLIVQNAPFGLNNFSGYEFVVAIHIAQAIASLLVVLTTRSYRQTERTTWLERLMLLVIIVTHGAAAFMDLTHTAHPNILRDGFPAPLPLLPAELAYQSFVGLAHLPGLIAALFAQLSIINVRAAGLISFFVQGTWAIWQVYQRPLWESVIDPNGLNWTALVGIHIGQALLGAALTAASSDLEAGDQKKKEKKSATTTKDEKPKKE